MNTPEMDEAIAAAIKAETGVDVTVHTCAPGMMTISWPTPGNLIKLFTKHLPGKWQILYEAVVDCKWMIWLADHNQRVENGKLVADERKEQRDKEGL